MSGLAPRLFPPASRIAADGEPVYVVRSGAAYRGVHAHDVGNGLFVIRNDIAGLQLDDIEVTRGYRVIENKADAPGQTASCVGLRLRGARATELRRSFGRFGYASHDGLIQDVTASGVLTTGPHDLPVGIAFKDEAHDFRLERCTMRGFRWQREPKQYWNGDGFSAERGNARLTFHQCAAWDNSDGGFDLKSTETLLDDCTSGRNARNYRLWSNIRATRLTSVDPQKTGGIGDTVHFALMGPKAPDAEPLVIHIEHLVVRSSRQWPLFDVHDGRVRLIIDSHDIQVPAGTPLVRSRSGGSIPGGIQFGTAPPRL
ncbi:hypothetical protein IAG41_01210 [Sphingomonas sp. JC676]|uniref:hypothetical protein n=1 Tax=Sphingomonas sp. JC676 TaxID=2768065 RepID=UPI001658700E|nr:hypothetical protein [Sphingomonas sp. JC676]MBC9031000.1 hypothetical protein [Sphingomonas sp. JC676]